MNYGCQSMSAKIKRILLKRPEDAFISQENLKENYEAFAYLDCPDYEKALKEYEAFEAIIKGQVEELYFLPCAKETGLDSIYTHDALKVTEKGAIYFNVGKKLRIKEAAATATFLESIGIPTLGYIKSPGTMEGGDVVWLDENTVAIGRGYRTNDEGIRQFKALVKDFIKNVIVVPLPHADGPEACLHLMSIISMVDEDLAVVYSKYMPVFFRELLVDRGVKLLEVSDEEYDKLGSNVLALAPRKCLVLKGCPEIKSKLLEEKVEVFEYEGRNISWLGTGGATCLTAPLLREK